MQAVFRRNIWTALAALLLLFVALPALADVVSGEKVSVSRYASVRLTVADAPRGVTWASEDRAVAVVSSRGQVTGRRAGQTTVTATLPDGTVCAWQVTVTQPVTGVRLKAYYATIERGATLALETTVSPADATDKSLTYASSDESVATVSAGGVVRALKAGKTYITVTAHNGRKARLRLTVTQPVTGVSFAESGVTVERGRYVKLPARVEPADATNRRVTYATDNRAVATVSSSGAITGRSAGTAWITATASNGLVARVQVTVTQPVTAVSMPYSMKLERGATAALEPKIYPANATIRTLAYTSSDESVATVSAAGVVTALKAGRTDIIATAASGRKARLRLTVTQPVTGVAISEGAFTVNRGYSKRLGAVISPADATDKKVKWSSSDTSVARVSSSGTVTGRAPGSAVITATSSNGLTASVAVTVVQPVTRVSFRASRVTVPRNTSAQAEPIIYPANATDQTITWKSSNPAVASVDARGVVRGLRDGSCVVTATAASGKTGTLRVTVTSVKVKGVALDRAFIGPYVGETVQLAGAVEPADATERGVTFSSSNTAVATVDGKGVVKAVAAGQAVITATSVEGHYQATCRVTVRLPGQKRLEGVTIGLNPGHQIKGDTTQDPVAPGSKSTRNRIGVGTRGVKTGTPEYEVTLQVGLKLRDLLVSEGATVVMTRTANDVYITNIQRAQMLNNAGVALAIQLHCDGSDNRSANGISVWTRNTGVYFKESAEAGQCLLDATTAITGARNAGAHRSDNYMSLNYSTTPAVLIEMGYMSNAVEDVRLCTGSYQDLLAEGIMEGICAWLGR